MRSIKFRVWDSISNKMHSWHKINTIPLQDFFREHYTLEQYTGLKDKNGVEIYSNDLIKENNGTIFRVYKTIGGFAMKPSVWSKNIEDEINSDILIFQPLSDAQTISYIEDSCKVVGNIHENK